MKAIKMKKESIRENMVISWQNCKYGTPPIFFDTQFEKAVKEIGYTSGHGNLIYTLYNRCLYYFQNGIKAGKMENINLFKDGKNYEIYFSFSPITIIMKNQK